MASLIVASADLASLDTAAPDFGHRLDAFAEALGDLTPDAVCLRGAPDTALLRRLTAYLVRRQNRLLRTCTAAEHEGAERHLGIIFRQTNIVSRQLEHGHERLGLAVRLLEPNAWLVAIRAAPQGLYGQGPVVIAGPASAVAEAGTGMERLESGSSGDAIAAHELEVGAGGDAGPEGGPAIAWWTVTA